MVGFRVHTKLVNTTQGRNSPRQLHATLRIFKGVARAHSKHYMPAEKPLWSIIALKKLQSYIKEQSLHQELTFQNQVDE